MAAVGATPAASMSSRTASARSKSPAYEATLIMVLYVYSLPCLAAQSCPIQALYTKGCAQNLKYLKCRLRFRILTEHAPLER